MSDLARGSARSSNQRHIPRVLIGKVGLDGHDRGAKVVARLLRDEGFEVVYTGIRRKAAEIARMAIDEDVDWIGLSVLSGTHLKAAHDVLDALRAEGAPEIPVVVGGTVPPDDVERLREMGVAAVFGVGSGLDDIRAWTKEIHEQ
jgi:methylmalonyl-CoA mutase C-terminal domain/subunit